MASSFKKDWRKIRIINWYWYAVSGMYIWDVNNLYDGAMSGKLPVNNFEWIEDTSSFNEDFIKNYNGESDEGDSLDVDI